MRGSLDVVQVERVVRGIIPAHAGLTVEVANKMRVSRDHPRACGAHHLFGLPQIGQKGSSPRMRGSPRFVGRE